MVIRTALLGALLSAFGSSAPAFGAGARGLSSAGERTREAAPVALLAGRVLTMDDADTIHQPGMVWMVRGTITYVGLPREVPEGFLLVEREDAWAIPGMIDLHSHIQTGGWGDINDMCRTVNPELRASAGFVPGNRLLRRACATGVTTLFGIPGSGTNLSGFGILYKTKPDARYRDTVIADPGGMKVAQDSNPERRAGSFAFGNNRASMSWALADVVHRARAAARSARKDPALENLVRVLRGELPVLIHTAGGDGVGNTVHMWSHEFHTRCFVSHGSFDGWKVAEAVGALGVPVNHGPRTIDFFSSRNGKVNGTAALYASQVPNFSLNTDAGVIPQEELFLQGAMGARYGGDPYDMLRAVTIHPARTFGIDDRVGSLETGKDADVVLYSGDPLDPRSHVEQVWIDGELQYARERDGQWF